MIGMRKKSGQLITLRHIFCIEKLMNMNKFLSALRNLDPDTGVFKLLSWQRVS